MSAEVGIVISQREAGKHTEKNNIGMLINLNKEQKLDIINKTKKKIIETHYSKEMENTAYDSWEDAWEDNAKEIYDNEFFGGIELDDGTFISCSYVGAGYDGHQYEVVFTVYENKEKKKVLFNYGSINIYSSWGGGGVIEEDVFFEEKEVTKTEWVVIKDD